jgi:hypothetical protein
MSYLRITNNKPIKIYITEHKELVIMAISNDFSLYNTSCSTFITIKSYREPYRTYYLRASEGACTELDCGIKIIGAVGI